MAEMVGDAPLTDQERRRQLTRAVIASTIGTTIEWYDFFLYSTMTGLVFGKLYFPNSDPLTGTLKAFIVYAVGFIARPIGAAIFGHYGDRIGRKSTLVATLLLMGTATFLVALVPGYAQIGIWGAVLLTTLRFLQGVGVGGEWGGSVLLSMEWAGKGQRGLIASWPQFGVPAGLFIANLAVLGSSAISGSAFSDWGWRLPFLFSLVMVAIGLYIRLGILETPTFRRMVAEDRVERAPTLQVLKLQWREIILAALLKIAEQTLFYIFTAFVFSYATTMLHAPRNLLLSAVLAAAVLAFVAIPFFGHLSDRLGRKRMYLIGLVTIAIFSFIYIALLDTRSPLLIFLAIAISLVPHAMLYGPQAALIAELFTGRLRYSGASLGYQLAAILAGGPAPLIATAVLQTYQSGYAIAAYILVCCVISIIATAMVKDYTHADIEQEYDQEILLPRVDE